MKRHNHEPFYKTIGESVGRILLFLLCAWIIGRVFAALVIFFDWHR